MSQEDIMLYFVPEVSMHETLTTHIDISGRQQWGQGGPVMAVAETPSSRARLAAGGA